MQRICRLAKVPVVCTQGLRGTQSTISIEAVSVEHVAAALGQKGPLITGRAYLAPGAEQSSRTRKVEQLTVDLRRGMCNGYETYRPSWLHDRGVLHVVEIDLRLCDRRWPDAEDGTVATLIWYTAGEDADAVHERRREQVQIGEVVAS